MASRLNVLIVVTSTDRRGAEVEGSQLAEELRVRGHVAKCVALAPGQSSGLAVEALGPTARSPRTLRALRRRAHSSDVVVAYGSSTLPACAIALLGARVLWPSPERTRFPSYAVPALRNSARYLATVVERYGDTGDVAGEAMRAARRAVGLATVNAEESLQRAFTEEVGRSDALAPAHSWSRH